ncbi:MAG: 5'/3'-nucleotidase SurE [bacterium]|nr:5'/3'-nucleotidase SurE [bacterium]
MNFLLTNDDGINSSGIFYLKKYLSDIGKVIIITPDRERSATGHALTLNHPVRIKNISEDVYVSDGTPADCVNIAVQKILSCPPDIIISGINPSPNLGDDVTYSGTVAAAMEGTLLSIPSISISTLNGTNYEFEFAAKIILQIIPFVKKIGLPQDTFLNINVPDNPQGIVITKLGRKFTREKIIKRIDPRGNEYFWIGIKSPIPINTQDTDVEAIHNHLISITPLNLDFTDYKFITSLKKWNLKVNFT